MRVSGTCAPAEKPLRLCWWRLDLHSCAGSVLMCVTLCQKIQSIACMTCCRRTGQIPRIRVTML